MDELYLGIDSATPYLSLALWSPTRGTVAERIERLEREHARRIIVSLDRVFREGDVGRDQVTAIACGIGPGSYTGLRIGLATAAGLARALGVPLAGCDTLAAMAAGALDPGELGIVALDARRGNVYAGCYQRNGETLTTLAAAAKVARATIPDLCPGARLIEGVAPDPVAVARSASRGAPAAARYL